MGGNICEAPRKVEILNSLSIPCGVFMCEILYSGLWMMYGYKSGWNSLFSVSRLFASTHAVLSLVARSTYLCPVVSPFRFSYKCH